MVEGANKTYHKSGLYQQLSELTRLVGELKTVRADGPRVLIVKAMDVALFSALGHLREME